MRTEKNVPGHIAFAAGLLAGSFATFLLTTSRKNKKRDASQCASDQLKNNNNSQNTAAQSAQTMPDEIRSEMLSRNSLYFASSNGMPDITTSCVLVVGLGGVGSHTAHMLARSGVKYLRLVDFDQVTLSSLNRHAVATLKDVGLPKATVLCNYLRQICPDECRLVLDPVVKMYTGDRERDGTIMDPPDGVKQWDVVIDAIDDVPTKANLIGYCAKRDIRVISCMGAGGKADPTRVHISDLRSASRKQLATAARQRLRMMAKKEAKDSGEKITNGSGVANGGWAFVCRRRFKVGSCVQL